MSKQKPRKTTDEDKEIGFRIRKIRQDKKISQIKVANSLGISYQQLQKYELGKNKISASRLKQIALILDVPEYQFFSDHNGINNDFSSHDDNLWKKIKESDHKHLVIQMIRTLLQEDLTLTEKRNHNQ